MDKLQELTIKTKSLEKNVLDIAENIVKLVKIHEKLLDRIEILEKQMKQALLI